MQSRFANIANFALDAEVHRPRYREKCDAQAAELRTLRQQLDERDSELIEEVPSAFSLPKLNATGEAQKDVTLVDPVKSVPTRLQLCNCNNLSPETLLRSFSSGQPRTEVVALDERVLPASHATEGSRRAAV